MVVGWLLGYWAENQRVAMGCCALVVKVEMQD